MTGGGDAPCGATAQAQKRTDKVVRLKSHRPTNANPTIIKMDLNPGYGKRALSRCFLPLFQTLAIAGSTTERTKGNIYESIDSAQNNSTTSHHTHAPVLYAFAKSASDHPAIRGSVDPLQHGGRGQCPF